MSASRRTSDVLVIIPAFNEELSILNTYNQVRDFSSEYDIIVVNDGSTDQTKEVCKQNHIPMIDLVANLGVGGAVQTGYKYALYHGYKIAIQFDGDGQHNAEFLPNLIKPIQDNVCDFTVGSRFLEDNDGFKSSWKRRFGIRLISSLLFFVTHKKISDPTSGFRACNQKVMKLFVKHYPTEYPEPSSIVLLHKYNYVINEVPVLMNVRLKGFSTITSWKSVYYMVNVGLLILLLSFTKFEQDHE